MNYYITSRLGAITLLIVSVVGIIISGDSLLHYSGLIPSIIYTLGLFGLIGSIYMLLRKD